MVSLTAAELSPRERHHILLSTIVPRPIAWITTLSPTGLVNAAPFSFFNGISATPPLVMVAIGHRRDGTPKDTQRNIETTREFVIHVVDEAHAHEMVETSADFPPDESELDAVGLKTAPSVDVRVPRIADAPVAMECRYVETYAPGGAHVGLVIGEVLRWHMRDNLVKTREDGLRSVDVHRLRPVGRLGGEQYCPVREVFDMARP